MTFNTPDTPHEFIVCNQEIDTKISYDIQNRYRSVVGSLLYLVKHSRTELSTTVHKLSKCMYKANMSHYKYLLRPIKYVIYTKYYFYHMKLDGNLNGPWDLLGYNDMDYAGDNDTQKSVTVCIFLIDVVVIAWRSQSQKTNTLHVTEVEY